MLVRYDGTFEGFLTVLWETWGEFTKVREIQGPGPGTFFEEKRVPTDKEKSERVYQWLKREHPSFLHQYFRYAFLSSAPGMDYKNAATLHRVHQYGEEILESAHRETVEYVGEVRKLKRELHRYLGLTRFQEIKEGGLYGPIRPEGNILLPLGGHFLQRIPKETFCLHDVGRNLAFFHRGNQTEILELSDFHGEFSDREEEFSHLWKVFTKNVAIGERRNLKLQQSFMPKKYWEFLTEMKE